MAAVKLYSKLSPFQRVVIALILGILTGIFVGEPAGILEVGGTIYIRLLQMTVLPYVLVSIIGGLGRLDTSMAANIGIKAVKIILFMWLAVMLTLLLLPLAYPTWETSGFFSTSLVTESVKINFVDLYIPSNIFAALSNTIVPAVVLFSLLMGVALITVSNKEPLVHLADNVGDSLQRVASYIATLAPLGIFAIAASAAGTLQPEEMERLQVFLWVYLIAASLLGFVLLPLLVHWATPFSYRELMSVAGEAMITALATGTVLVVLPMIAERCKELLKKHDMECEETESTVDVMVPTAYSFPSTGTLLGLGFILFSAWYVGSPLELEHYPSYVVMGALSAFGSMAVAIPFLLDYYALPADQFQLYLLGSVVTARFATALAALHGFVVTLLVASAVLNRLSWHKMMQAVGLHLGMTAGVMILAGIGLTYLIPYEYTGAKSFEAMRIAIVGEPVSVESSTSREALSEEDQTRQRLDIIRERGTIRLGYTSDSLPYAFHNTQGDLVGFDMEMMHELARDLDIKIELTHVKKIKEQPQMLSDGRLDIVIGGRGITPLRALVVDFSDSYSQHTLGFMVADSMRDKFSSAYKIGMIDGLKLGVLDISYYKKAIQELFPNAELTTIESPRKYFQGKHPEVDAFVYSVEAGFAWAMLYPDYSSVVAKGLKSIAPIGFALPKGQLEFVQFINTWLRLKKESSYQQQVYDYWILGKNPKAKQPRWSVIRNLFGWDI
jgi:Na+/H+-dicarboxylate symporter